MTPQRVDLDVLRRFRAWVTKHGAAGDTTARDWMYAIGAVYKRGSVDLADYPPSARKKYRLAWRAWKAWRQAIGAPDVPELIWAAGTTKRQKPARSLPEESWRELLDSLDPQDDVELVIRCVALTGWRIGDVLRLEHDWLAALDVELPEPVLRMVKKGGKQVDYPLRPGQIDDFSTLRAQVLSVRARNVAQLITRSSPDPSGHGAAYQRVRLRIIDKARAAGITDRVYLHRLRRTIAVMLLRRTKDTTVVTGNLLHDDPRTALTYLDEVRLGETTRALDDFLPPGKGK